MFNYIYTSFRDGDLESYKVFRSKLTIDKLQKLIENKKDYITYDSYGGEFSYKFKDYDKWYYNITLITDSNLEFISGDLDTFISNKLNNNFEDKYNGEFEYK